jgi:hypothetical protein
MNTEQTRYRSHNSRQQHLSSTLWKKRCFRTLPDISTLTPSSFAQEVSSFIIQQSRGKAGSLLVTFLQIVPDSQASTLEFIYELIKVYTYEKSQYKLFTRSIRLFVSRKQLLVELVDSDPLRSRNYFARRAADTAQIPTDVVHMATHISVAVDTGALPFPSGDWWYPPSFTVLNAENVPLLQLLTIIFTHERVFPVCSLDGSTLRIKLESFDTNSGAKLFGRLFEHYLLQNEPKEWTKQEIPVTENIETFPPLVEDGSGI